MASNQDIIREASYFLDNDVTVEQASKDLGISKRTLQLHLKKLESIAPDTFRLVEDKKKANEKRGRVVGGTLGKRKPTWSGDDAVVAVQSMLDRQMTYREAEEKLGVPRSTLYEMTHSDEIDSESSSLLYTLSQANKRGLSVQEYEKRSSDIHIASDMAAKQVNEDEMYRKKGK
ncbi:MAG: hypothetical protein IJO43_01990 [Bacilli bacterium]|nr:hypothetical protein [Bacilli bacterium]